MPDQEQSPLEPQPETETAEVDPLVGFTIDDVKSALARVTDEVLLNIQVLSTGNELPFMLGELASASLDICKHCLLWPSKSKVYGLHTLSYKAT